MKRERIITSIDPDRIILWIVVLILVGREFGWLYVAVPLGLSVAQLVVLSTLMKGHRNVD